MCEYDTWFENDRPIDIHSVGVDERSGIFEGRPRLRNIHMSCFMRKPDFCICENKDAEQLRGKHEADQRL